MRRIYYISICFIFIFSVKTYAQTVNDYTLSWDTTGVYDTLSQGSIIDLTINSSATYSHIPIGFNFIFTDSVFTQLTVTTRGFIVLGGDSLGNWWSAAHYSTGRYNIIPFNHANEQPYFNSLFKYTTTGTAPYRKFLIEWRGLSIYIYSLDIRYQIELQESTGKIIFRYGEPQVIPPTIYGIEVGLMDAAGNIDMLEHNTANSGWLKIHQVSSVEWLSYGQSGPYPPLGLEYYWTPDFISGISQDHSVDSTHQVTIDFFPEGQVLSVTANNISGGQAMIRLVNLVGEATVLFNLSQPDHSPLRYRKNLTGLNLIPGIYIVEFITPGFRIQKKIGVF